jgi:beta-1,4-mannosyltransferase
MRVLQTFGEPRPTTNPYLVMLRDALVAEPSVEHVPFSWREALVGRYDVLHVHWPDALLAGRHWWTRVGKRAALAALAVRARAGRIGVVRTVHNLVPAPGPAVDRVLARSLDRSTDVRIRLSAQTPESPGIPSVLIPHGHYRSWFGRMPRSAVVPGQLGYVGLIKPYKGVERLVAAFAAASAAAPPPDAPALTLRIAGAPADDAIAHDLREAAARLVGLDVTLRYVDDPEFVDLVTSSELVVLPYRDLHNSGAALAALSLDRPVLVPDNDVTRALAAEVGPRWVHRFSGELTADGLLEALRTARGEPASNAPDLHARDWDGAGAAHADAYRLAMARRARRRGIRPASKPTEPPPTELVVAIPTFHRGVALRRALTEVRAQVDAENDRVGAPMRCSILVVDNDPAGSGEAVAREQGAAYVVEPRPGIAAVRNRALAECDGSDALLFLDDDEVPEPGWLRAMVDRFSSMRPTAVAGRVVTRFPDPVHPWVAASGAFIRPVRRDGQAMREAATNNLLLDVAAVRRLGLSFDERFGLTGGSDSMFTLQLTRRGGTIRWAQDAVVTEQEEPERFTRRWVLARTFRFGNTSARVRIALAPTIAGRLVERLLAIGRGAARVLGGGARLVWGTLSGSLAHRARGARTASRGLGMLAGAVGYAHDEYGRRRAAAA